ncbi:MAG: GyrI-like domain-containing protein [Bacteroidota bacterium]
MQNKSITAFQLIGIEVRTTNENAQAGQDIGALWQRLLGEDLISQIPNKTDGAIVSLYTDYESDHTKPYTAFLGCRVSSLEEVPSGMVGRSFEGGPYNHRTVKGNLEEGLVYQAWVDIWGTDLDRSYTADFEVYGEKALDRANAEVDIFVALK